MRDRTVRKRKGYIPSRLSSQTGSPAHPGANLLVRQFGGAGMVQAQLGDGGFEVLERVERLVDAREAQIGDLVELPEGTEDRQSDLIRIDLRGAGLPDGL